MTLSESRIHEQKMSAPSQNSRPIVDNFNKVILIESPSSPHHSIQSENCDEESAEADNENSTDSVHSLPAALIERDSLLNPDKR